MSAAAENKQSGPSAKRAAEAALDEVILESFPASDPPASWSGAGQSDPIEPPGPETADDLA